MFFLCFVCVFHLLFVSLLCLSAICLSFDFAFLPPRPRPPPGLVGTQKKKQKNFKAGGRAGEGLPDGGQGGQHDAFLIERLAAGSAAPGRAARAPAATTYR
jgi:hypothetical protein